jgi:hypothetical protein
MWFKDIVEKRMKFNIFFNLFRCVAKAKIVKIFKNEYNPHVFMKKLVTIGKRNDTKL